MTTSNLVPLRNPHPPEPPVLSLVNASLTPSDDWEVEPEGTAANPSASDGQTAPGASESSRWTGGFAYAPENNSAAALRDVCDDVSVDAPEIPAPTGVAAVEHATGGTLTGSPTTYTYKVTFVNANGETTGSLSATAVIGSGVTTGSATISWDAPEEQGVTANVYGRIGGSLGLIESGITGTSWTDTGAASPGAAVPSSNTTGGTGTYTDLSDVEFVPYLVVVEDSCSSFGFSERDYRGRATRLLDSATPKAIGREFWRGDFAQAKSYPNNYLANSDSVTDITPMTVPSLLRGIQLLEDALSACGFGGRGMLHVQPQTAPNLLGARLVTDDAGVVQLVTILGNIVVADSGYDGTGPGNEAPSAGYAWIYATDLVTVRTDDPVLIPDTLAEALDRGQNGQPNRITFRAERFAAATFDAGCHFACKVQLDS